MYFFLTSSFLTFKSRLFCHFYSHHYTILHSTTLCLIFQIIDRSARITYKVYWGIGNCCCMQNSPRKWPFWRFFLRHIDVDNSFQHPHQESNYAIFNFFNVIVLGKICFFLVKKDILALKKKFIFGVKL